MLQLGKEVGPTPAQMNVDPQGLAASAELAEAEYRNFSSVLQADDAALDSQMPGWVGQSCGAMAVIGAHWRVLGSALGDRIAAHAEAFRRSGRVFAEMDARHAAALTDVCRRVGER